MNLNIRNVDEALVTEMKIEALKRKVNLRDICIERMSAYRRVTPATCVTSEAVVTLATAAAGVTAAAAESTGMSAEQQASADAESTKSLADKINSTGKHPSFVDDFDLEFYEKSAK